MALAQERPELTVAVDNLWPTMDPVIGISTTGARVHWNLFDTLARRNFHEDEFGRTLQPHLATGWERTSPTVWTITLRQGVTFHDGHEMDAEDVAFSMSAERLWGPEPIARRGTRYARGIVRVEATGPYTVEIETGTPDPSFPNRLVTPLGFVLPKHHYEEVGTDAFGQAPIGTGPYRMVEFDPSDKLVAVAYDAYWNGAPPASQITWKVVPEYSTRYAGLAAGEFDIIVGIPADQEEVVTGTEGVTMLKQSIENYPMFAFNTLSTELLPDNPLQDANLRKAMVMAIDRDAITEALWGDASFTPAPFNFPEYGDYYDPDRQAQLQLRPGAGQGEFLAESVYDGRGVGLAHHPRLLSRTTRPPRSSWSSSGAMSGSTCASRSWTISPSPYQRPFHLLNMSMSSEFSGDPYRPLWMDWGPQSSRCCASHKTWVPSDAFLEIGATVRGRERFGSTQDSSISTWSRNGRTSPRALYLWRNVVTYAYRDGIEWRTGAVARTLFDSLFLKIEG